MTDDSKHPQRSFGPETDDKNIEGYTIEDLELSNHSKGDDFNNQKEQRMIPSATNPADGDSSDSSVVVTNANSNHNINSGKSSSSSTTTTTTNNNNNNNNKPLRFWECVMMMTALFTSGNIVMIPFAFGQLGYVLGPIWMIVWTIVALRFNFCVLGIARKHKCQTLGDVGYYLAGQRRCGRSLFDFFQIGEMVLAMPVILENIALSAQYLFDYPLGDCGGWWKIFVALGLYGLIQFVKTWRNVAWVTYLTFAICLIKAYGLLPYAYVEYQDEILSSQNYNGPAQAFGNPEGMWALLGLAVSTVSFGLSPIFIMTEISNDAHHPIWMKKASCVAMTINVSLYLVAGVTCVVLWGWNVTDPITLQIPEGTWVGSLLALLIVINMTMDYVVCAKITTEWLGRKTYALLCMKNNSSSRNNNENMDDNPSWLVLTFPFTALALVLTVAVPNFPTLVGVVVATTIIGVNTWGIPLAWYWSDRKSLSGIKEDNNISQSNVTVSRSSCLHLWMLLGFVGGVAYTLWSVASSAYEIATADYTAGFFCSGI